MRDEPIAAPQLHDSGGTHSLWLLLAARKSCQYSPRPFLCKFPLSDKNLYRANDNAESIGRKTPQSHLSASNLIKLFNLRFLFSERLACEIHGTALLSQFDLGTLH